MRNCTHACTISHFRFLDMFHTIQAMAWHCVALLYNYVPNSFKHVCSYRVSPLLFNLHTSLPVVAASCYQSQGEIVHLVTGLACLIAWGCSPYAAAVVAASYQMAGRFKNRTALTTRVDEMRCIQY